MSLFFNQDYTQRDYAAFSDPLNGDAYSAGDATYVDHGNTYNVYTEYKTGITDPYFIGADSTNSRVLSDAQFQGTF
jgi:hypothetical protein